METSLLRQVSDLKEELGLISMTDEFAKYSKIKRKLNKASDELSSKSECSSDNSKLPCSNSNFYLFRPKSDDQAEQTKAGPLRRLLPHSRMFSCNRVFCFFTNHPL